MSADSPDIIIEAREVSRDQWNIDVNFATPIQSRAIPYTLILLAESLMRTANDYMLSVPMEETPPVQSLPVIDPYLQDMGDDEEWYE